MAKTYTAQEMREMVNYAMVATRGLCGWCVDNERSAALQEMLRQAADALEREERCETKYEYSIKFVDGSISQMHEDERLSVSRGLKAVRRSVGEWEEVRDGEI